MSACPEAAKRAAMTDDEFWQYVADRLQPYLGDDLDDESAADITDDAGSYTRECGVCGAIDACTYDTQGEPLIHAKGGQ